MLLLQQPDVMQSCLGVAGMQACMCASMQELQHYACIKNALNACNKPDELASPIYLTRANHVADVHSS